MEHREYQAPIGFVIDSIVIRCVHCSDTMPPQEAATHKLIHAIERSREQGSGRRQCGCVPGRAIASSCPKHGHLVKRRRQ